MMNRYIFLDFDGVLNTENHQRKLTKLGEQRVDKYGPLFDPSTIRQLEIIIEKTGAKICLISSWCYEGEERMRCLWKDRKMPGELLATCYNTATDIDDFILFYEDPTPEIMVGKGRDVKAFLSGITKPYEYVIIDDVPDFYPEQMKHYIKVNPTMGIDENVAKIAINILGKK